VHLLIADFETYYAKDYTLSKLSTEEYIRDPRFETIGVSVRMDDDEPEWFSGTHAQTREFLMEFPWDDALQVAHNNLFDGAILGWRYGIHPKRLGCTMAMARAQVGLTLGLSLATLSEYYGIGTKGDEVIQALGKRRADFTPDELAAYGRYCCNDTNLCRGLFDELGPGLPLRELELIDLTLRMFTEPVLRLDKQHLAERLVRVQQHKADLMEELAIEQDVLMSNSKLADLLTSLGVDVPLKVSPTTRKLTQAFAKTDTAFTALLEHPDERVQAVVAARLGVKSTLEETRTERFIGIASRGTLPVPLRYYGARTGRWSGEDKINLQNLPRESDLKESILAPPGTVFIDADSSQIEARVLAWLAGQWDLVEIFEKNDEEKANGVPKEAQRYDPYRVMASQIYNVPVLRVDDAQRFMGKTVLLGCGYGMGWAKFQIQLEGKGVKLESNDCQYIIETYREAFPKIKALWKQAEMAVRAIANQYAAPFGQHDVVTANLAGLYLPNRMVIKYPNLREETTTNGQQFYYDMKPGRGSTIVPVKLYGAKAVENVCQALARIIIGDQMLAISRRLKVVMTVHDAVGVLAPEEIKNEARAYIEQCMRKRPKWAPTLPLNCESKMGPSYG
jgi:DNA polymerase